MAGHVQFEWLGKVEGHMPPQCLCDLIEMGFLEALGGVENVFLLGAKPTTNELWKSIATCTHFRMLIDTDMLDLETMWEWCMYEDVPISVLLVMNSFVNVWIDSGKVVSLGGRGENKFCCGVG